MEGNPLALVLVSWTILADVLPVVLERLRLRLREGLYKVEVLRIFFSAAFSDCAIRF